MMALGYSAGIDIYGSSRGSSRMMSEIDIGSALALYGSGRGSSRMMMVGPDPAMAIAIYGEMRASSRMFAVLDLIQGVLLPTPPTPQRHGALRVAQGGSRLMQQHQPHGTPSVRQGGAEAMQIG